MLKGEADLSGFLRTAEGGGLLQGGAKLLLESMSSITALHPYRGRLFFGVTKEPAEYRFSVYELDLFTNKGEYPAFGRYFTQDGAEWNAKSISANDTTDRVPVGGHPKVTVHAYSDTAGTLTVQVREPDGEWRDYDTMSVSAGGSNSIVITGQASWIRVTFDAAATITCWYEVAHGG